MAQIPQQPSLRKSGQSTFPNGAVAYFDIIDEIRHTQTNNPEKFFCLQQIKWQSDGEIEFRFGYYIIGEKPNRKGKWVWGQSCPMIPTEDFKVIMDKAKEKGWL